MQQIIELGIRPYRVPRHEIDDGINGVRAIFPRTEFDEHGCSEGLKALRAYRKEWDEDRDCWKDKPRHDWASHGADAMRYAAMAHSRWMKTALEDVIPPAVDGRQQALIVADPARQRGITLDDLFDYHESLPGSRAQRI